MDTILHKYADGTELIRTTIQRILRTPVWHGNRILDVNHVQEIKESLKAKSRSIQNLDSGYHIIIYNEIDAAGVCIQQSYLIDGQHRRNVIEQELSLFDDFDVTCSITHVENESEVITKFNEINSSKPIKFNEDIKMIINRYVDMLVKIYGNKKLNYIRNSKTSRPYCSVDDIRNHFMTQEKLVRLCPSVEYFMKNLEKWNSNRLTEIELEFAGLSSRPIRPTNISKCSLAVVQ
jgi:hypothetical protein